MTIIRPSRPTLSNSLRSNSTLTAPTGIANNDILVACLIVGNTSAPTVTPPSGFSEVTGYPIIYSKPTDPWYVNIHVYTKVASSESGNYTFTHGSAYTEGIIYAVEGADTSTPVSPTPTQVTYSNADTVVAPSITPARNSSAIFWVGGAWDASGPATPPAGTTPTFTEDYDPGTGGVFYAASGVLAIAAATGTKSVTFNQGFLPCGGGMVCIQAQIPPVSSVSQLGVEVGHKATSYSIVLSQLGVEVGYKVEETGGNIIPLIVHHMRQQGMS